VESIQIKNKHFEPFINEKMIGERIEEMAAKINADFEGKNPIFLCVLNGAFMFAADLLKHVKIPCEIDFIKLKSYQGTKSQGNVRELYGLSENIENRHIIIVEDIVDTGLTIKCLTENLKARKPASVKISTLLFKPNAMTTNIKPDYVAMEIPNDFIVGYGLDYDGLGRNLKNIYRLKLC
jgi:hypoxanthine phosphoribosyltransferase